MALTRVELEDFRRFTSAAFEPDAEGITVLTGPNGAGKTSVLEAIWYLGHGSSFRTTAREAMVRNGAEVAYLRATLDEDGRSTSMAAELPRTGRGRITVNAKAARGRRQLAAQLPATLFSPGDNVLVHGSPSHRRDLLDQALLTLSTPGGAAVEAYEAALKQRNALLRGSSGFLSPRDLDALGVWDAQVSEAGEALAAAREELVVELTPLVRDCYAVLEGVAEARISLQVLPSTELPLSAALVAARADDLRRGTSTVGPHRDDLLVELNGLDARVQASQGEQRCLALSLRLAVHRLETSKLGKPPILLLDDVFSELDPRRSAALADAVPGGQAIVTSAVPLPESMRVSLEIPVEGPARA